MTDKPDQNDRQLLEQALEALEYIDLCDNDRDFLHPHECFQLDEVITAIKQALAAPTVQEPVAEQGEDLYDLAVRADNGGQP